MKAIWKFEYLNQSLCLFIYLFSFCFFFDLLAPIQLLFIRTTYRISISSLLDYFQLSNLTTMLWFHRKMIIS